jgi:hypothetical protein
VTYPSSSGSRPVTPVPPADQYPAAPVTTVQPVQTQIPPRHVEQPTQQRRKHKTPLGWLPWALLGLLALLLLLSLLAGKLVGNDDKGNTASQRTGDGTAAAAGAGAGALTVGSTDLLADRANLGKLGSFDGKAATGRKVQVQSVVADEGFWVGSSAADRVFVYLTPEARKSNGESGFQVKAGQSIDLSGTVARLGGEGARALGVTDAEGARQLTTQAAYVRADQVRLSS